VSRALAVFHGHFGRATVYQLNRPFNVHAHREGHLIFHIGRRAGLRGSARAAEPAARRYRRRGQSLGAAQFPAERFDGRSAFPCFSTSTPSGSLASVVCVSDARHSSAPRHWTGMSGSRGDDLRRSLAQGSRRRAAQPDRRLPTKRAGARRTPRGTVVPAPRVTDFRVRKSIKLLARGVGAEIEFDAIAREAGLSRPHFYKLFSHPDRRHAAPLRQHAADGKSAGLAGDHRSVDRRHRLRSRLFVAEADSRTSSPPMSAWRQRTIGVPPRS